MSKYVSIMTLPGWTHHSPEQICLYFDTAWLYSPQYWANVSIFWHFLVVLTSFGQICIYSDTTWLYSLRPEQMCLYSDAACLYSPHSWANVVLFWHCLVVITLSWANMSLFFTLSGCTHHGPEQICLYSENAWLYSPQSWSYVSLFWHCLVWGPGVLIAAICFLHFIRRALFCHVTILLPRWTVWIKNVVHTVIILSIYLLQSTKNVSLASHLLVSTQNCP